MAAPMSMTVSVNDGAPQDITVAQNSVFSDAMGHVLSQEVAEAGMTDDSTPASTTEELISEMTMNIEENRKPRRFSVMFNSNDTNWLPQLCYTFETYNEAFMGLYLLNQSLRSVFARFAKTWIISNDPKDEGKVLFELPGTESGGVILPEAEKGIPAYETPAVLSEISELQKRMQATLDRSMQMQMAMGRPLELKTAPAVRFAGAAASVPSSSDVVDV